MPSDQRSAAERKEGKKEGRGREGDREAEHDLDETPEAATGVTEGEHDREHTEQDMHSEWFSRAEVEQMMRDGVITDAQSLAAWALYLLTER